MSKKFLVEKAKRVLIGNFQKKGFTIPSKNLYPFQWKWDSGFIAIGLAHFDIEKAIMTAYVFLVHYRKKF